MIKLNVFLKRLKKRSWSGISKWTLLTAPFDARVRHRHILKELKCVKNSLKINKFSTSSTFILDVGAGSGHLTKDLLREGFEVIAMDIDSHQMKKVRSSLKVETIVCDAAHLCFRDKSFDIVVSSDVYEHLNECQRFHYLSEMLRVAKRKVIFTISQVHRNNPRRGGIRIFEKILGKNYSNVDWWCEHNMRQFPCLREIDKILSGMHNESKSNYRYCSKAYQGVLALFLLSISLRMRRIKLPSIVRILYNVFLIFGTALFRYNSTVLFFPLHHISE